MKQLSRKSQLPHDHDHFLYHAVYDISPLVHKHYTSINPRKIKHFILPGFRTRLHRINCRRNTIIRSQLIAHPFQQNP